MAEPRKYDVSEETKKLLEKLGQTHLDYLIEKETWKRDGTLPDAQGRHICVKEFQERMAKELAEKHRNDIAQIIKDLEGMAEHAGKTGLLARSTATGELEVVAIKNQPDLDRFQQEYLRQSIDYELPRLRYYQHRNAIKNRLEEAADLSDEEARDLSSHNKEVLSLAQKSGNEAPLYAVMLRHAETEHRILSRKKDKTEQDKTKIKEISELLLKERVEEERKLRNTEEKPEEQPKEPKPQRASPRLDPDGVKLVCETVEDGAPISLAAQPALPPLPKRDKAAETNFGMGV